MVRGAQRAAYERLLPAGSFIFADDFETPEKLGIFLTRLARNSTAYARYLTAAADYHCPVKPSPMCDLCAALNDDTMMRTSHAEDLSYFWDSCKEIDHNKSEIS